MTRLFKAHAQTIHDRILKTRACYIITRSISSLLSRPHYQACQKHIGKSGPSSFGIRRMVLTKARTESGNLPNGTQAPSFELLEPLTGKTYSSTELENAPASVIIFICNHCPFVKLLKEALVSLGNDYGKKGVKIVAISSNSAKTHPQDGPDLMAEDARNIGYPFPYLYDETQEVAKAYKAVCTPEFFVFNSNSELQYHGQFDDARPSNGVKATGEDVRSALDDILAGRELRNKAKPSIGCSIKWHP